MLRLLLIPILAVLFALPQLSSALTLDFEADSAGDPIDHGDVIDLQYEPDGVRISASNPNRDFDIAMAFDTTRSGTADSDLESPWSFFGNLDEDTALGNVLILSENPAGGVPDDEGSRPGGELTFDLDFQATSLGLDIVDVESAVDEAGGVDFYQDGALVGSFEWADLLDAGSVVYDPSVAFFDRSANRIEPVDVASLMDAEGEGDGLTTFDRFVVRMGGSGAIDNLEIEPAAVPEPAVLLLLATAAALFGRARRSLLG